MDYLIRIRNLREDRDYTQKFIAQKLNVCQRTYSDYESGKTRIPLDSMIELSKIYGVSMDFICCLSDKKKPIE